MAMERITVKLPEAFNPTNPQHHAKLIGAIAKKHGEGFEIDSIDPEKRVAYAVRQATITEVSKESADVFQVRLAKGTRKSDGEKNAARLEDAYPGYTLTKFDPHLGIAEMAALEADTVRCRGAVANALSTKSWEIDISRRTGGGWVIKMPNGYVPSRHDEKLLEVATAIVGQPGWTFVVDPATLEAEVIPGEPPTFPGVAPYPFKRKVTPGLNDVPLGLKLMESADDKHDQLELDLTAVPHGMVSGTTGSGKSVVVQSVITGSLVRGAELVIVDLPAKKVDYLWCQKYVRKSGFGADSLAGNVTALALAYEEGNRRAELMGKHGATKWTELPAKYKLKPIVIVVDEVTGLFQHEKVPKGLPKDHPLVVKPTEENLLRATIESYVSRIAAEMRFAGLSIILASQVSSTTTGVSTALRLNLGAKMLLGVKPTDNNRRLALSDAGSVPKVPAHIAEDKRAGRGVGVAELEGQESSVFKGYFATTDEMVKYLDSKGVPTTKDYAPTAAQIAQHTPALDDKSFAAKTDKAEKAQEKASSREAGSAESEPTPPPPRPRGAAGGDRKMCPACDTPIDPLTGECACSR